MNEQIELLQRLNQIVRDAESFREAEKCGKLVRLPTGDGMALLFFRSPEEPVQCALEISRELKKYPHIQLRMGVHSGPVNQVRDVNDTVNVAGAGINVAQRVMDCGEAGHILVSKHVADDLSEYRHWQPYLRDLGEYEAKHGLRLHIFNFCKDDIGNPHVPEKLRRRSRWKSGAGSGPKWALASASIFSAIAIAVSISTFFHRDLPPLLVPEKSIAVLPLELEQR